MLRQNDDNVNCISWDPWTLLEDFTCLWNVTLTGFIKVIYFKIFVITKQKYLSKNIFSITIKDLCTTYNINHLNNFNSEFYILEYVYDMARLIKLINKLWIFWENSEVLPLKKIVTILKENKFRLLNFSEAYLTQ